METATSVKTECEEPDLNSRSIGSSHVVGYDSVCLIIRHLF